MRQTPGVWAAEQTVKGPQGDCWAWRRQSEARRVPEAGREVRSERGQRSLGGQEPCELRRGFQLDPKKLSRGVGTTLTGSRALWWPRGGTDGSGVRGWGLCQVVIRWGPGHDPVGAMRSGPTLDPFGSRIARISL